MPPSEGEHRAASDTLARLLRVYGDALFATDPPGAREKVRACDEWADHVRSALPEQGEAPRADWAGLLRFFAQQRRSECEQVGRGQEKLRATVRSLTRDLQECLATTRHDDSEVALAAGRVGAALAARDDDRLLHSASELLDVVASAAQARNQIHEQRKQEMRALIEEALASNRAPGRIDPATRLPGPDALLDHLEFVASVGRLMQNPPVLVLLALDAPAVGLPADAVARVLADEALRRFFAREHFVARAGETLVAAVLPATDLSATLANAEAALAALVRHGAEPTAEAGALATLVPGEEASCWWQRCHDLLEPRPWDGSCRVAAVPAQFD